MNVVTALDKVENEYSILSKLGCHANTVELLGVIDAPDSDDLYYSEFPKASSGWPSQSIGASRSHGVRGRRGGDGLR